MAVKTKKSYHHGDLYSELLSAGRSLLEESGTHNLSLRNLAKTIGVSHNAPYRHFKDKAALMMAIADSGFKDLTAAFHKIIKKYPDDPRKQFKEFGLAYLQLAIKNPETTDLMFGGFTKKEKDWIAQPNQSSHASFQLLVDVIESGQEKGLFKIENPLECAIVAWSSMHGLAILITSGFLHDIASSKNQIKQLGERLTELLLSGIQS